MSDKRDEDLKPEELVEGDLLRRLDGGPAMRFVRLDPDKPDHAICSWSAMSPGRPRVEGSFPVTELRRFEFTNVIGIRTGPV